jgi:hypothetical protein
MSDYQIAHLDRRLMYVESKMQDWQKVIDVLIANPDIVNKLENGDKKLVAEELTREYMISELRQRVCRVIFKKVNGEERDMQCTLIEKVLPLANFANPISQKKVRAVNDEVIVAFDTLKGAYRSFRVENVISFT